MPSPAPPAAVHTHSQGKAAAAGAGTKVRHEVWHNWHSLDSGVWGQWSSGDRTTCSTYDLILRQVLLKTTLGACGQLKQQLCARSFWNIEITTPCDRRVLSPGHGRCPLRGNGVSPCTKVLGVPLHLLLGSSWESKPREGPWSPTAAGCKQKEGQEDQGHPPAAQGQYEPPDLGWLSYTLASLCWGELEVIPRDTPCCRLWGLPQRGDASS